MDHAYSSSSQDVSRNIMLEAEDIRHRIKAKSGHANFVTAYDEKVQEYLFRELKKLIPDAAFVGKKRERKYSSQNMRPASPSVSIRSTVPPTS